MAAVLVLAAPWVPAPVHVTAMLLATLVAVTLIAGRRQPRSPGDQRPSGP